MNLELGLTQAIITECKNQKLLRNQTAYVLASCFHESAHTMMPVVEAFWKNEAWRKLHMKKYYPWYGRGLIQITHKANYEKAGEELDMDLTTDPTAVLDPDVSIKIAVRGMKEGWFTGKKLKDYIDLKHSGFIQARRIVNGLDRAELIADFAKEYDQALKPLFK